MKRGGCISSGYEGVFEVFGLRFKKELFCKIAPSVCHKNCIANLKPLEYKVDFAVRLFLVWNYFQSCNLLTKKPILGQEVWSSKNNNQLVPPGNKLQSESTHNYLQYVSDLPRRVAWTLLHSISMPILIIGSRFLGITGLKSIY